MAWLVVETEPDGRSYQIGSSLTIGRERSCQLRLQGDLNISRRHCTIHRSHDGLWLEDGGSTNGTRVNGVTVRGKVQLRNRDRIEVGSTAIRVLDEAPILRAPAPAAPRVVTPLELERTSVQTLPPVEEQDAALDDGSALAIENGLLVVGRAGSLRVQLWNVRIDHGGFFLRIPLVEERPPSSRLHRYVGKGRQDVLVLEPGDIAFEALLAEAQRHFGALPERERVERLTDFVYRALGGTLSRARLTECLAWCAAQGGKPVPIGELIRMGSGTCRHRAFLFFHLAQRLGLRAELYRGAVSDERHAWNVVRVGDQRVFVDATLNVVLDHARDAEESYGYLASRHDVTPLGAAPPQARLVVAGEGDAEQIEVFRFRHELRKVPGDEEAVLLLYPEGELPAVRYLHVQVQLDAAAVALFAIDPFVSARVFAIIGDEAHHRMDALDRDAAAALRRAWPLPAPPKVG